MKQSVKSQLLYELFLYPGNEAKYYKERLALSDATFARMIAQLKENLKSFDAYIVIANGYRIRGENEAYVGILFTHLLFFFRWDIQILYNEVEKAVGSQIMQEIKQLDFSRYLFTEDRYEAQFFHVACAIGLLRQAQRERLPQWTSYVNCKVTLANITDYFEQVYEEAVTEVEHAETFPYKGIFDSYMFLGNRERLKQLGAIFIPAIEVRLPLFDTTNEMV